jgi:TonB family protein
MNCWLLSFSTRFLVSLILVVGLEASVASTQEPQKDTAPPTSAVPQRIRVGGKVQQAKLLHFVQPEYPADAKKKGIQGTVLVHAIVGKDGTMAQIQFVSGPSELMRASMDAVKQWRYQPTTLKGNPVEVDTTIAVVFTLSGKDGAAPPQ